MKKKTFFDESLVEANAGCSRPSVIDTSLTFNLENGSEGQLESLAGYSPWGRGKRALRYLSSNVSLHLSVYV